jgi:hypothetical protein
MPDIIELIEKELRIIADAKAKLKEYRQQLAGLYAKLERELGEGVSVTEVPSAIEQPTTEEVLGGLTPKAGASMIELSKRLRKRYGSAQLRKVLAELEAEGKVSKKGQKRSTTYSLKQ